VSTPGNRNAMQATQPPVVFVNRFFHPDVAAASQMLSDLAFALAARGRRVRVITSRLTYEGDGPDLPASETIAGVEVLRLRTTRFGRANLAGRAVDYLSFYGAAMLAMARQVRPGDLVVVKTDPPVLAVALWPLIRWRGGRMVNWLQDVFPEVAEAFGLGGGLRGKVLALLRGLRDRTLRGAALTVVLGERMAALAMTRGAPAERIRIIPNWADGLLVRPLPPAANPLRREWNLADRFVVGYSGNLGRAHDTATMLDAIRLVAEREPAVRWLFIGGGAGLDTLRKAVPPALAGHVLFRPYQPRERLAESLSVPDVHLISLKPSMEGLIVPSKAYGIAAAGRPSVFIGDGDGELARLNRRHGIGLVVREGDAEGLATAILSLAADPGAARAMGERARALFDAEFDLPHAVARWEAALDAAGAPGLARTSA
jgi:glycosyltransferase involved in cell wall biosynthesis